MKNILNVIIIIGVLSCSDDDFNKPESTADENSLLNKNSIGSEINYWWDGIDFPKPNFLLQQRPDILWGVNGHPISWTNQYDQFTNQEQIEILKALGVDIYRFEGNVDNNGKIISTTQIDDHSKFIAILNLLQNNEMQALPVIKTTKWREVPVYNESDWNYNIVKNHINTNNPLGTNYIKNLSIWKNYYRKGVSMGKGFALNYSGINYYSVGNEIAHYIVKNYLHSGNDNNHDGIPDVGNDTYFYNTYGGDTMTDFFTTEEYAKRMISSLACYSGMIDGIKSIDFDAKCIITENRINFGYLEFAKYMGVQYDIVGYNFYGDDFEDVLGFNLHTKLSEISNNKPIWITEVNRYRGSFPNHQEEQAQKIRNYITQLYKLSNIKAIIEYELIDYGNFGDDENYYGLMTPPYPTNQNSEIKPGFNTFRFSIEELKFGYDDFFYLYYLKYKDVEYNLLNLESPNNPISYWSEILRNGGNLGECLEYMIKKDCKPFIRELFFEILGVQNPDPAAIDYYWSAVYDYNLLFEDVISDITSSNQFFGQAQNYYPSGSQSVKFIKYAYLKLTENTYAPNSFEVQDILQTYPNLVGDRNQRRNFVRAVIMELPEYKTQVLIKQFKKYLDRSNPLPQDPGIQYHLNNYTNQKNLIKTHLLSREFWQHSIISGYYYRQNYL